MCDSAVQNYQGWELISSTLRSRSLPSHLPRRFCSLWFSSSCLSVWSWLSRSTSLTLVRVGVFPAGLAKWWHFTLTCRLLSVASLYCLFPKLCIFSKSLLCLASWEAALYGGCDVVSSWANDRLIRSSVASWLFSFVSWSLIEKIVFSLCVFYL